MLLDCDAQATKNETRSHEIDPKHVGRNPRRNDAAYALGIHKVLGAENHHGHGDEGRTAENELIQAVGVRWCFLECDGEAQN